MTRSAGASRLKNPFRNKQQQRDANALTSDDLYEVNDASTVDLDSTLKISNIYNDEPKTNYQALEVEQHDIYVRDVESSHDTGLKGGGATKKGRRKRSNDDDNSNASDENEVYIVRQQYGYCSILFSLAQTAILVCMMVQCGIAPLQINPMWGPYPSVLSEWGAKNTVLILDENEYYRLLTPILLHAGVIHLICNVAVQLETGVFFEKEWGSLRWCLIYLTSAIGSSVLSCIVMPNALSVGSSGAVMGLFGAKLAEVVLKACERVRTKQDRVGQSVRKEQCCVVSCSVVLILLFSFIPYVDWAAHVGGLAAGILVGWTIFAWEIENRFWRVLWFIVGTAGTVVAFFYAFDYLYSGAIDPTDELRDVCQYYKDMLGGDYECTCQRQQQERSLVEEFFFGRN
ncbi:hypothetical protein MPSEU_000690800 [Mayamaea pseudoterrestris]|nr:hypothetical protein MPSEU_000690800 [Mayamaea pseudoterrestris]